MTDAYEQFTLDSTKTISLDKKKEAYSIILLRSMMNEDEVLKNVTPTSLTKAEIKKLFACYSEAPKPLVINTK